jgi:hypothetical protein
VQAVPVAVPVQAVPVPGPGVPAHIGAESRFLVVLRGAATGAEAEGPVQ